MILCMLLELLAKVPGIEFEDSYFVLGRTLTGVNEYFCYPVITICP